MIKINDLIEDFGDAFLSVQEPWDITNNLISILEQKIRLLKENENFIIKDGIAIHKTAVVEANAVLKGPVIIGANCFVAANAYLRDGVYLADNVKIGSGCEIKSSIIFQHSAIAHFNYIGNSIIGKNVNFEAGAITANHYNERVNKEISVCVNGEVIPTHAIKFGALVGDHSKIGANAVLSPGTILAPHSIVKRLELVEQVK